MKIREIICCCCSDYHRVPSESIRKLSQHFAKKGVKVCLIDDLCYQTIHHHEVLKDISDRQIPVFACHKRAVNALFAAADVSPPPLFDLCAGEEEIIAGLQVEDVSSDADVPEIPEYFHEWQAWFPAIDRERCNGCGKCIDYCLFGVYSRVDRKVTVTQPANCKTNCPACARMCPQQAIVFPKHPEAPVNGGEAEPPGSVASQPAQDEDLYARLAQRRRQARKEKLVKD